MSENRKPTLNDPWRWAGFVLPALAGLLFWLIPNGLALLSFDLLFRFRPATNPAALEDVVILKMDEDSIGHWHLDPNAPWDRRLHARLVRELKACGAKVVVFDVLFSEAATNRIADAELAAAFREHGRVVLAASIQAGRSAEGLLSSRLLAPASTVASNATWGVVEWPNEPGPGTAVRRQLNTLDYTNLAWQAAVAFQHAPANRLATHWLNYYGPEGTLTQASYWRALETNSLPANFFKGKAVFIGPAGIITSKGQVLDQYSSPFSRWQGGQISGVELHATAFLNLVRREWFEELPPGIELLVFLLVGALFGFLLQRLRPWTALGGAVAGAVIVAGGSFALTWGAHLWFPWLIVCAVQIPAALGCSLIINTTRLLREQEDLGRKLAVAESLASLPELLERSGPSTSPGVAPEPGPAQPADSADAQPPSIPNHQIIRQIGRGSYGDVWLAKDDIGTFHAVKVVYRRSFESVTPYEREFKGIQKFTPISRSHPGFVHILHVGRDDAAGCFFYIMELGDDPLALQKVDPATYSANTLARRIEAGGRLPVGECVQLGLDLTAALEYLHQQKLVHRDIKPSNIIFLNRAPKFADVGLVTDMTPTGREGTYIGTEGYIAPEGPGTAMADIFSLGKVLYEACTGQDRRKYPSLSGSLLVSDSPGLTALNDIILKACHPEPRHRYQTAALMHADLAAIPK